MRIELASATWLLHLCVIRRWIPAGKSSRLSETAAVSVGIPWYFMGRLRLKQHLAVPTFQPLDCLAAGNMSEGLQVCSRRSPHWRMPPEHESMDRACPLALLPSHNACFNGTQSNSCDVRLNPMRWTRAQAEACRIDNNNNKQ